MAATTTIEWTDATWNAIRGCTKVSTGCANCYAVGMAARFSKPGLWGHGLAEWTCGGPRWTGNVVLDETALTAPLRWKKPRRIFVTSGSDPFHPAVTDEMLDRLFAIMALCPQHTFQLLTKRPERMREYFINCKHRIAEWTVIYAANFGPNIDTPRRHPPLRMGPWTGNTVMDAPRPIGFETWPLPNIWLGVSVEDQAAADERIPHLLATPAAKRFLSCEPLLGPVDIIAPYFKTNWGGSSVLAYQGLPPHLEMDTHLHWVIVGGESGPKARPMHPDWALSLRDQCAAASVPFFFKQWGRWTPHHPKAIYGKVWAYVNGNQMRQYNYHTFGRDAVWRSGELAMISVGKRCAGRLLDGQEHLDLPPR